jgi:hypothetical protein
MGDYQFSVENQQISNARRGGPRIASETMKAIQAKEVRKLRL